MIVGLILPQVGLYVKPYWGIFADFSEVVMGENFFAGRLRELREQKGLSQKELANRAGIGQKTISNWEQGIREPLWSNVLALCQALGVPVQAFTVPPQSQDKPGPGRPAKAKPVVTVAEPKRPRGRPKRGGEPGK